MHAPQEQAGLSLRERLKASRSQSAEPGLVLAQSTTPPARFSAKPGAARVCRHTCGSGKGIRQPLCCGSVRADARLRNDCGSGDPGPDQPAPANRAFRRDRRKDCCVRSARRRSFLGRRKTDRARLRSACGTARPRARPGTGDPAPAGDGRTARPAELDQPSSNTTKRLRLWLPQRPKPNWRRFSSHAAPSLAPYDGRVSERLAEPYQYVSEGRATDRHSRRSRSRNRADRANHNG